ncbi:hypothetical protein KL86DYS2_10860 [uncultured Dysgonomonas sp.]|uniref:Uncharacterized protein n=1 Tax=uncultured Dysgonomonas sp. TaxID=206096 RepID=A0A212J6T5_9BACT|nr:hypothetical protein KL86DYS2_10860 [uncultured Dysgonomonas sp.]
MPITAYQVQGFNLSSYKKNTPNRDRTNLHINIDNKGYSCDSL